MKTRWDLFGFLKRWWVLLIVGPVLAGVAGYVVVGRLTPVYQATTTLLVTRGTATGGPVDDPTGAEALGRTYVEALKTRPVLEEAEQRIGLSLPMSEVQQAVTVRPVTGTQILRLAVEGRDPSVVADLANMIVTVFSEQNVKLQAGRFDSSRQNLEDLVSTLRSEIDARTTELDQLRASVPAGDPQLTRLESDLTQLQATYSDSVRSYENLRVAEAQGLSGLTVVEPAIAPTDPVRPNKLQTVGIAVVAGLLVALGTGLLIEFVDDGLRTRDRLVAATNLRALAVIPRWGAGRPGALATCLSESARDRDGRQAAEAYRLLYSTVSMIATDGGRDLKTVMITSASLDEGKSVTTANLAAVFAEAGKRVILVDADVHRPSQMNRFEVSNRAGLSTLLLNPNVTAESVLRDTAVPGLQVVTAGPAPTRSAALYTSPRFAGRLAELGERCDVLLIDTAPVLAQSDAVLIGQHVDGALFVVDARNSRGRQVRRALEMLAEAGVHVFGAALNGVSPQSQDYFDYTYVSDQDDARRDGRASSASPTQSPVDGAS